MSDFILTFCAFVSIALGVIAWRVGERFVSGGLCSLGALTLAVVAAGRLM